VTAYQAELSKIDIKRNHSKPLALALSQKKIKNDKVRLTRKISLQQF